MSGSASTNYMQAQPSSLIRVTVEGTAYLDTLIRQFAHRRETLGLSQQKINDAIGIADRLLSKWECGVRNPSLFLAFCWADTLGCDLVLLPKETANHAIPQTQQIQRKAHRS